jgi:hypothetical protein
LNNKTQISFTKKILDQEDLILIAIHGNLKRSTPHEKRDFFNSLREALQEQQGSWVQINCLLDSIPPEDIGDECSNLIYQSSSKRYRLEFDDILKKFQKSIFSRVKIGADIKFDKLSIEFIQSLGPIDNEDLIGAYSNEESEFSISMSNHDGPIGFVECIRNKKGVFYKRIYLKKEFRKTYVFAKLISFSIRRHLEIFPDFPIYFTVPFERNDLYQFYGKHFKSYVSKLSRQDSHYFKIQS